MTRRRSACTQVTQQVWDAIKVIRSQRQVPTRERIARYLLREHGVNEGEVSEQLSNCVRDGLVKVAVKVKSERKSLKDGKKSDKTSVEQEAYSIPKDAVEKDGHDWYCFECHSAGNVMCCTTCYRVYHPDCAQEHELQDGETRSKFVCKICKTCNMKDDDGEGNAKLTCEVTNRLLKFACLRLAGRLPAALMTRPEPNLSSYASDQSSNQETDDTFENEQDDGWRTEYLIFKPIELPTMQQKTKDNKYNRLEEFQVDLQTIVHNVIIYHGASNILSTIGRQMLLDCEYDLNEMRRCPDCYRASNEMRGKWWFCRPCEPPHELVYAKQLSYPFWPAKVVGVTGEQYDVRFFGGQHERAVVDRARIRPITVSVSSLQVKRSVAWNRAEEELKEHQRMLEEAQNVSMKGSQSSSDEDPPLEPKSEIEEESKPPPPKKKKVRKAGKQKLVEAKAELESESAADNVDSESEAPSDETSCNSRGKSSEHSSVAKRGRLSPEDMVSSSCQEVLYRSIAVQVSLRVPKENGKQKSVSKAVLAKMQREAEKAKQDAIAEALSELEKQLSHDHSVEMQQLRDEHAAEISDVKLKQWCFNCEKEAIYHCCWNTAYCSVQCQQDHWLTDHKPHCRRKR